MKRTQRDQREAIVYCLLFGFQRQRYSVRRRVARKSTVTRCKYQTLNSYHHTGHM
uniref:Uncharacterized protein n=1 Tax=Anguilla anguilla TaxID=7936 RepID=A0A0E9QCH9_ANGAN